MISALNDIFSSLTIKYPVATRHTYDPDRPHAVKAISYTGTSPLDMGPRIISYNAEQMPIRIEQVKAGNTTIVDYLYDGESTRIKKSVQGGATTYYVGEHCEVINGVLTNYIFAGNLRIAKKTQQGRYYFHKDHLGSSTAMTDDTGAKVETTEYVPYGEMRDHQGTEVTNYKFTDQELDPETGLYNYGARLYDPVIGRFISPDTIIPDIYDPQSLNRYSYCRNNPLIYTDPTGHMYGDAEADGGWEGADYGGDPGDTGGKGDTGGGGYTDKTPSEAKGAKGGFSIPSSTSKSNSTKSESPNRRSRRGENCNEKGNITRVQTSTAPNKAHCDILAANKAEERGLNTRCEDGTEWDGNLMTVNDIVENCYENEVEDNPPEKSKGFMVIDNNPEKEGYDHMQPYEADEEDVHVWETNGYTPPQEKVLDREDPAIEKGDYCPLSRRDDD